MIKFISKLFNKPLPEGITYHMQDHQGWGDSIRWTNWPQMRVHGHLYRRPEKGDILTCDFKSGAKVKFQFTKVEYCQDPSDMFFADVKYIGEV